MTWTSCEHEIPQIPVRDWHHRWNGCREWGPGHPKNDRLCNRTFTGAEENVLMELMETGLLNKQLLFTGYDFCILAIQNDSK
jgi:hypothetical protein